MQRNFGRNRNYLNFRAIILSLLSGGRAAFGETEKLQVVCLILWKWLKIVKTYQNVSNILSKALRNISQNVNCAVKRYQNLQYVSEFIKARENSNSFRRNGKCRFVPSLEEIRGEIMKLNKI